MGRAEDEIQKKLLELEISMKEDELAKPLTTTGSGTGVSGTGSKIGASKSAEDAQISADMYMLGGVALIGAGLLMMFNHIRIQTSIGLMWFGMPNGFLVLPLLIGIGMLFYNYKSRAAQIVTTGGLALILFSILAQLALYFPAVTMLQFVLMVVPMAAGIACIAKGRDKTKAIEEKKQPEEQK